MKSITGGGGVTLFAIVSPPGTIQRLNPSPRHSFGVRLTKLPQKSSPALTTMRRIGLASYLVTVLLAHASSLSAATLPAGFSESKVADRLNPTTMVFAPDGRLFLCEKQGRILVIENGSALPTPLVDFSGNVDSWNERGLGGICLDPDFASNGHLYVYYTAKSPSHNRVSRLTVVGNTASTDSEQIILELDNLSAIGWHNGGGLCFGKDGKLYVATGENADGANAQNPNNLLGKLLRINRDGSIPSDNPNFQRYSGRSRAIVALGFRNPFALAVQPDTGLIYASNVGAKYEELERYDSDATPRSLNYGWPKLDGPRGRQAAPSDYRDPAYAYDHGSGEGTALCGGDFYSPSAAAADRFPANYHGCYFFSDYRGWIKYIDPRSPSKRFDFAAKIDRPIDVQFAPDGSLWYIARAGRGGGSDEDNTATSNGSLWRVRWTGTGGPTRLEFVAQPSSSNTGGIISPAIKVAVQDAQGETFASSDALVTISTSHAPRTANLHGTLTRRAINGVATFDDLRLDGPAQAIKLICTSSELKSQTSDAFDVLATADPPHISPRSGTYGNSAWVQMASMTQGAKIRYTTDGSTPTETSPIYEQPFQVTRTSIIKAYAERPDLSPSAASDTTLTITDGKPYGMDFRPELADVAVPSANGPDVPRTLSSTGLFRDVANLDVRPGVVPYGVNSPLWSDNAEKARWVALPPRAHIGFEADGSYRWPGGSMFVKHFDLVINEQTQKRRRLETRLLVVDSSGENGYGVTYRWRDDNRDADLLISGLDEEIEIVGSDGQTRMQTWHYPSQQECLQCHTVKSGFVLGPNTRQLNGEFEYPAGRTDNQIRAWNYLQMFSTSVDEERIDDYDQLARVDDPNASLEHRVRSYFDVNCAFCHLPGGTGSQWDGRYETPLADQKNVDGDVRETFGIAGAKIVAPSDLQKSIMHLRMTATEATRRMPPVGSNVVDQAAVDAITQWIQSLPTDNDPGIVSGQTYYLTAKHSQKRLEVPANSLNQNGAGLRQWSSRSTASHEDNIQQWRFDEISEGDWRLTNVASGRVLDLPGGSRADSVHLQQYNDNGGDNQRWAITPVDGEYFLITSKVSGKNLDVDGISTQDGAEIHQYQDTGNDNQLWKIEAR